MKNLIAVVLAALMSVYSVPVLGTETKAPTKQSMFLTQKACESALANNDYTYYVPVFIGDKTKNPIDNVNVFGVKLEANQCRRQHTMKGVLWVVQPEGTLMRARKGEDGELIIFARDDCGNMDVTPKMTPTKTAEVIPATKEAAPAPSPVEPIKLDIRVRYDPPPVPAPATTGLVQKKRSHTVLYVIGGILLAGGIAALAGGGGKDKKEGPIVTTLPPG